MDRIRGVPVIHKDSLEQGWVGMNWGARVEYLEYWLYNINFTIMIPAICLLQTLQHIVLYPDLMCQLLVQGSPQCRSVSWL
jgi:hypothetical protein